ncbi:hypothetical protein PT974_03654 [Cladobotryum mycophilum]|uniref:HNH nuclease domain-containing protein n=1 Tax=Cladobotryum mycophilum TaxID=491253 RepID=A0ABR0SU44_9HYPO
MASAAVLLKASRVGAWNVQFLDQNYEVFAGVYQRDNVNVFNGRPHLVCDGQSDEEPFPAPEDGQPPLQFLVVHHDQSSCVQNQAADIRFHLSARCAKLVAPKLAARHFYQPINKKSNDATISSFPFRRRSVSPRKRSKSGSVTPNDGVEDDASAIAPSSIDSNLARIRMTSFRDVTMLRHDRCAITGLGKPWPGGSVRLGIHACHIVPQIHYHVYPLSMAYLDPESPPIQSSRRMLEEQWNATWSPDNGICLASHMHELYDNRLISIQPTTLKIRVFAPYDMILPYHGRTAYFSGIQPSKRSLEHHWRVTCIENMVATHLEPLSPPSSQPPSSSLLELSMRPPILEDDGSNDEDEVAPKKSQQDGSRPAGNTGSKKRQAAADTAEVCTPGLTDSSMACDYDSQLPQAKRLRPSDNEVMDMLDGGFDRFISDTNHRDFLADVNWELRRWAD